MGWEITSTPFASWCVMNSLPIVHLITSLVALPSLPSDTPPALPVPVDQLTRLSSPSDVIAVARLADGSPAPAETKLPELVNLRHTLEYMRVHYPRAMVKAVTKTPTIAWIFVTEKGRIAAAHLVLPSGHPPLDSLSLDVLSIAEFKPAEAGGRPVGLWLPFPAGIPPHEELINILERVGRDISEVPVVTPYTDKPVLLNRSQVEAAIVRVVHQLSPHARALNEVFMRAQRAGGLVRMHVFVDQRGTVGKVVIQKTSGNTDLDNSAKTIARMMRFAPAKDGAKPVPVWIEIPIQFKDQ